MEETTNIQGAIDMLEQAGLAKDMTDDELQALAGVSIERTYTTGAAVIHEDARSRDLYILKEGRASVRLAIPSDYERSEIIYTMHPGQIFGELSLVDGSPRSATINAEEQVIAYQFPYSKLSALLDERPRIGYMLMRNIATIIAARVRNTNMMWRNSMIW